MILTTSFSDMLWSPYSLVISGLAASHSWEVYPRGCLPKLGADDFSVRTWLIMQSYCETLQTWKESMGENYDEVIWRNFLKAKRTQTDDNFLTLGMRAHHGCTLVGRQQKDSADWTRRRSIARHNFNLWVAATDGIVARLAFCCRITICTVSRSQTGEKPSLAFRAPSQLRSDSHIADLLVITNLCKGMSGLPWFFGCWVIGMRKQIRA